MNTKTSTSQKELDRICREYGPFSIEYCLACCDGDYEAARELLADVTGGYDQGVDDYYDSDGYYDYEY